VAEAETISALNPVLISVCNSTEDSSVTICGSPLDDGGVATD
jgi:hypothetical protein